MVIRVKFRPVGPERGSFLQLLCRALNQKLLVSDNNCYTLFWHSGRKPFTSPWPRRSACVHTVISLISLFGKNLLYLLGSLCCLLSPRSYLPAQLWAVVSILTTLPGPHKCSLNKWVDQWIDTLYYLRVPVSITVNVQSDARITGSISFVFAGHSKESIAIDCALIVDPWSQPSRSIHIRESTPSFVFPPSLKCPDIYPTTTAFTFSKYSWVHYCILWPTFKWQFQRIWWLLYRKLSFKKGWSSMLL